MSIVDFGRNTYQFQAQFRFNVLDANLIRGIVDEVLLAKKYFSTVSADGDTDDTTLNVGDGSPQHPFFHLRISPNRLLLWGGWHNSYDTWQSWRSDMIATLEPHLIATLEPHLKDHIPECRGLTEMLGRSTPAATWSPDISELG